MALRKWRCSEEASLEEAVSRKVCFRCTLHLQGCPWEGAPWEWHLQAVHCHVTADPKEEAATSKSSIANPQPAPLSHCSEEEEFTEKDQSPMPNNSVGLPLTRAHGHLIKYGNASAIL